MYLSAPDFNLYYGDSSKINTVLEQIQMSQSLTLDLRPRHKSIHLSLPEFL